MGWEKEGWMKAGVDRKMLREGWRQGRGMGKIKEGNKEIKTTGIHIQSGKG